ncbi:hypothetical protein L1887_17774 [Cichorium endivia]|nr:hypothetical protein L1887_17774 [Cichorium endivia]
MAMPFGPNPQPSSPHNEGRLPVQPSKHQATKGSDFSLHFSVSRKQRWWLNTTQCLPIWLPTNIFKPRQLSSLVDQQLLEAKSRIENAAFTNNDSELYASNYRNILMFKSEILLDSTGVEDLDKLLISTLFEVVTSESRDLPFILFMKDAEKSIVGSSESYSTFKTRLEKLPDNVVVIRSQTHADSRIEKSRPGGLLFTKFGSNQTALLDLAFPVRTCFANSSEVWG